MELDLQDTVNEIVSDLNRELSVNFNSVIDRLADANVNMSQINSVGVVGGGAVGFGLVGGSATVTVLADKDDPSIRQEYVTIEVGIGPVAGPPTPEVAVVAYQGNYDGYRGWFAGVQGSAGITGTAVVGIPDGNMAFIVGGAASASAQGVGSITFTLDELQNLLETDQLPPELVNQRNFLEGVVENGGLPTANNHCFLEDSTVQMWPLDPSIKPRADGSYDEELVLSKVWYKRQDQMQVGDLVVSYDKQGRLQPGPVVRTMTNTSTHILDFWGTGVTPGHAYHCADGPLKGGFAPLMDILRMDGALMRSNGTMFRSTTNCDVGSVGDMMIHAAATMQKPDGSWTEPKPGKVRFGTRIILPDGRDTSLMELAHEEGWKVTDDGYMIGQMQGEDGTVEERAFHFPYRYGAELPKPEDYILKRSAVTLEEIYLANEWEQIGTRMPAPDSLAGFNPNSTMKRSKPKPNIPPAFANRPDAPTAQAQTQRPAHASASPSAPSMNRKQRKAMEAKQRKAAKTRKKLAS